RFLTYGHRRCARQSEYALLRPSSRARRPHGAARFGRSGGAPGEHNVNSLLAGILGFVLAAIVLLVLFGFRKRSTAGADRDADQARERLLADARREAETIQRSAEVQVKDDLLRLRTEYEAESRDQRRELQAAEKRQAQRDLELDKKSAAIA